MDKQRLQELAGITPTSQKLAELIQKDINSVDENLSINDLAKAVAYILKNDYGSHNYESFLEELKIELNIKYEKNV